MAILRMRARGERRRRRVRAPRVRVRAVPLQFNYRDILYNAYAFVLN